MASPHVAGAAALILASEEEDGAIGRVIGDAARFARTEIPEPEGFDVLANWGG